jgi:hypothetical protein
MEDGSTLFLEDNKTVAALPFCRYVPLKNNIGRAAIRNRLADEAKYEHLLFLDCDSEICSNHFIRKYLPFCNENSVVLGGRIYRNNIEPQYSLLWKYGRQKERNDAKNLKRRKNYSVFTSPNFLISKSVFCNIRFDETIKGYGHEDTVFGIMLGRANAEFKYIDNPVIHSGIEDNTAFIRKTEDALRNLYSLYLSGRYRGLEKESRILSYYIGLKRFGLTHAAAAAHRIFGKLILKNLLGKNPSLQLFDAYKLGILCSFNHKNRIN